MRCSRGPSRDETSGLRLGAKATPMLACISAAMRSKVSSLRASTISGRRFEGSAAQARHLVDFEGRRRVEQRHETPAAPSDAADELARHGAAEARRRFDLVGGEIDDFADRVDQQPELAALAVARAAVEDHDAALLAQ